MKTNYDTLGYDSEVKYATPNSVTSENEVTTVLKWAQDAGKNTGFVTTARVTHATPAALYAHTVDRNYECDGKIPVEDTISKDIAWQLVHQNPGNQVNVILGGGRPAFFPKVVYEEKYSNKTTKSANGVNLLAGSYDYENDTWDCRRSDDANLAEEWLKSKRGQGVNAKYVDNLKDLNDLDVEKSKSVLGLFGESHIVWKDKRNPGQDPSLTDMTKKAIEILDEHDNDQGFFLMVEGARIDQAHHETWANRALEETMEFDEAIEAALGKVDFDETLVIVTADHSHTFTISGYSKRGSDINGLASRLLDDGLPQSILNYANGKSIYDFYYAENGQVKRKDLTGVNQTKDPSYRFPSAAYNDDENHGGEDVATYAIGPMSHLIRNTHEQSYIAYVMSYAACIGPMKEAFWQRCIDKVLNEGLEHYNPDDDGTSILIMGGFTKSSAIWFFVLILTLLLFFFCTSGRKHEYNDI